jgi:uncharacterized membrane protein YhhN
MAKVFTAITVIGAFTMVALGLWGPGGYSIYAKMTAATSFICLAVSLGALKWNYGRVMVAGLFLSWWGDWFLAQGGDNYFLFGLVSFLLAHVMYCAGFGVRGVRWSWAGAALVPVVAMAGGVLLWISPHVGADMTWPVRVYTVVISSMVVLAFGAKGAGGPWSIPIGAVLFWFSDISVASGQFDVTDFPNYVWGLPAYFIGQVFLAWSTRPETDVAASPAASRSAA